MAVEQADAAGQTVSSQADGAGPEDPARSPRRPQRPQGDDRRGAPAGGPADPADRRTATNCNDSGLVETAESEQGD